MSYFNNENESVRDTLNRVMTDMGYFDNPVTINTPVGSRTFYEPVKSPIVKSIEKRNDDVIHNHHVMPKANWGDVVMGAVTGFGDGINSGLERLANNLTFGLYGDHVSGYEERQNKIKQRAEQEGLGNAYKWATRAIDYRW